MPDTDQQKKEEQRSRDLSRSRQETPVVRRSSYDPFALRPSEFFSNPFSAVRRMHEEMDRMFAEAFGGRSSATGAEGGLATWSPTIEVSQKDNEMMVCAELPGLRPEDVKVEVTEDALVIEGERKQEHEETKGGRWHSERRYGHFYRTVPLPEGANPEHARADFKDGELKITVPIQRQESKRREIPIGGAGSTERLQKK